MVKEKAPRGEPAEKIGFLVKLTYYEFGKIVK